MPQDQVALGGRALEEREPVAAGLRRVERARRSGRGRTRSSRTRPPPPGAARRPRRVERFDRVVRGGDHVAAPVAVEPHGADRLTDLEVRVRLHDALGGEHRVERADATPPFRSGAARAAAVRKRIASGCLKLGSTSSSGIGSPSAWRTATSTRSTPTAWRTRSAIWPPGMRAATSTTRDRAVVGDDQLRECDPVAQAERVRRRGRRSARPRRARRRRSTPGRRGSSRRRSRSRAGASRSESVSGSASPSARDHDPVQLEPVVEALDDRLVGLRLGERDVQMRVELVLRLDVEDAALAARVGGLQHRRDAGRVERGARALQVARSGEPRLRHAARPRASAASRSCASSGARSRGRSRAARASSATAATTGTARSAETVSTPSTAWRRATSVTASTSVKSTASPTSAAVEPGRVRVAVDGDDAKAELLRTQDRATLVAPRADEEDRAHVARDAIRAAGARSARSRTRRRRRRNASLLPACDLAAVAPCERDPHSAPVVRAGDDAPARGPP